MKIFRFHKSFNSVIIGLAESGNFIPPEIASTMTQEAIDDRSADRHLITLCECSQLRDAGLIATNVSPLVVDLTQPLPESPADSDLSLLYHQTMHDGRPVYKDTKQSLQQSDHQLRRNTFYLPFFQKMNSELDRLIEKFGSATLLMLSWDNQRKDRTVRVAGDISNYDFSDVMQAAKEMKIEFEVASTTGQPLFGRRIESDSATACSLTISPDCLLEGDDWSDQKADQLRELLAKLVGRFLANPL